jgi:hypothetical protein
MAPINTPGLDQSSFFTPAVVPQAPAHPPPQRKAAKVQRYHPLCQFVLLYPGHLVKDGGSLS